MIKNIRVKNFVHFYEEQNLSFEEGGPYFFVGGNASGKTCMLEAIRRCMSSSKNMGASSSHKPEKDSVVVCKFAISDKIVAISGIVYIGNDKRPRNNGHDTFVKFVCVENRQRSDQESQYYLYVDLLKKDANNWAVNGEIKMDQNATEEFRKCLFERDFKFERLSECVKNHIVKNGKLEQFSKSCGLSYEESTECETFLLEEIDERVVIAFPVHGVSPVQWTMSKSYKREQGSTQDYRQTANKQIRERSEIVSWYFGLTNGDVSEEEKKTVDLYFKKITHNDQLGFKNINSEIVVEDHGELIRLDQCPGGYFEAMNWSIMLAINKLKTICLDEVSKCMHQQMIERMRDLVLRGIKGKVVIATTHIPTFFSSETIRKAFIFRRQGIDQEGPRFAVISSKSILDEVENSPSIFQSRDYSTLFFAKRVMFVEGNSDLKVLSALKLAMFEDEHLMKRIVDEFGQNLAVDQFYHFLSSLHLIPLHGHKNKLKFHKVCKKLTLEYYLLLDLNAVIEKNSAVKFLEDFKIEMNANSLFTSVSNLEAKSILVWSSGNIEDALATLGPVVEDYLLDTNDSPTPKGLKVCSSSSKFLDTTDSPPPKRKKRCSSSSKLLDTNDSPPPKRMKLFSSSTKLKDGNLMKFARHVLEGCLENPKADFCRLLHFLLKYANPSTHDKAASANI